MRRAFSAKAAAELGGRHGAAACGARTLRLRHYNCTCAPRVLLHKRQQAEAGEAGEAEAGQ